MLIGRPALFTPALLTMAAAWPGSRLVEIWNSLPSVRPVRKFTNRKVAFARIWKAIQALEPNEDHAKAGTTTKTLQVIALLKGPAGATLQSLMEATGWQAHTVRGFLSGHLRKRLGLRVKSFKRDGERVYAIKR